MFHLERDYELYSEKIYSFLYFLTFDEALAEDLMQETFIRAHLSKGRFRQESNTLTWLRTIARNLAFDHFKRKTIIRFLTLKKENQYTDNALTPEQVVHVKEEERALYQAVASLKYEYRAAIALRKIEQLSIKETAEVLGWNEAKVRNNTDRGLKELKKILKGRDFYG